MDEENKTKSDDTTAVVQKTEVPVDTLKSILDKVEALEADKKSKDEQIELLRQSVSRYKLEEAEFKNARTSGLPKAKLMKHAGNIAVGLKWTKREYIFNPLNPNIPSGEDLRIKLVYSDGSESLEMPYVSFVRNLERVEVEKVGEKDMGEYKAWIVRSVDGAFEGELTVDPQFINP